MEAVRLPPKPSVAARLRLDQQAARLRWVSIAALLSMLLAATAAFVRGASDKRADSERNRNIIERYRVDALEQELTTQKALLSIRSNAEKAAQAGSANLPEGLRSQIEQLEVNQQLLDKRFQAIEASLVNTPEKALALPLLRQSVEDYREGEKADVASLRAETNSVQTTALWALGLVITALFSATVALLSLTLAGWSKKAGAGHPEKTGS